MIQKTAAEAACNDALTALSGMYRLLARLWLRECDAELLRELCSPPLRDLFREAGGALPRGTEDQAEDLAVEFCRLFVGPQDHLPPFQSVWQTGQFQSSAATSMGRFIEVLGYHPARLPSGIMLDHLGVQLDVMGHLADVCTASCQEGEQTDALVEVSQAYFSRHLTWPAPLLDATRHRARSEFYRSVADITRNFLISDKSRIFTK